MPYLCRVFPRKGPVLSCSFAENDMQFEASYGSSPPCMYTCVYEFVYRCKHVYLFIDVNMVICLWSIHVCVLFLYFFIDVYIFIGMWYVFHCLFVYGWKYVYLYVVYTCMCFIFLFLYRCIHVYWWYVVYICMCLLYAFHFFIFS